MLYSSDIQLIKPKKRWQAVNHSVLQQKNIQLWLCHLDTGLPEVSGNKCLKLKYHLLQVVQSGFAGVVTFGGAYSNHLCAVAASCHAMGLKSVAYVRTDELDITNPTLAFCQQQGMRLIALDRGRYRQRSEPAFITGITASHPDLLLIPEGGSSAAGSLGVSELDLASTPDGNADLILCATASGGTLAGIVNGHDCNALGIAVVRDASLPSRVQQLINKTCAEKQWRVDSSFAGKGYGQFDSNLLAFCRSMAAQKVYVEPIYTGKALAGAIKLVEQDQIPSGSRLSFFHTGGLQGLKGLRHRNLITAADFALLSGSMAD